MFGQPATSSSKFPLISIHRLFFILQLLSQKPCGRPQPRQDIFKMRAHNVASVAGTGALMLAAGAFADADFKVSRASRSSIAIVV